MKQWEIILRHMQDYGSITTFESFIEYGITRLSGRIFDLKKKGYSISDEEIYRTNRYGKPVKFKKYFLVKEGK